MEMRKEFEEEMLQCHRAHIKRDLEEMFARMQEHDEDFITQEDIDELFERLDNVSSMGGLEKFMKGVHGFLREKCKAKERALKLKDNKKSAELLGEIVQSTLVFFSLQPIVTQSNNILNTLWYSNLTARLRS